MIVSTTENVPGRATVAILGLVTGNIVQAKHIGRDIQAGLRGIVGGKVGSYTEMLSEARADAVVNVRYSTSAISDGMSEVLAYGTAVKLR